MNNLIIVESPTKARTLNRFLGKDYHVESSMGHVRDLPKNELGIKIEQDFKPVYIPIDKKKNIVAKIKKEAKKASQIFLATDPDREGEAIAYHIQELLTVKGNASITSDKISRITFHEITKNAVKQALNHPGKIDLQLVDAQQARRILDRLVGYKLSPLLWRKVRRGLSAGRVQSVAVRLVVEKEREIAQFRPSEYWEIYVELRTRGKTQSARKNSLKVQLVKIDNKKADIKDQQQADKIVADLKDGRFVVYKVEKKEARRGPAAPFTTSTLTQTANRYFRWSSKKTMSVAQRLYEEGLITYHRTDSLNLSRQSLVAARRLIKKKFGIEYLPERPRVFKTKSKLAQEAHEAIRPTVSENIPEGGSKHLDRDRLLLYNLIWRRFIASQMSDAVFDQTTVIVRSGKYLLSVTGRVVRFYGWATIYENAHHKKSALVSEDKVLPAVVEGEELELVRVLPEQKFTQPPARYTEASLIKVLEKLGIGRPSTYAPTISTIQTRQYVEKVEGRFRPTPVGEAVTDFLMMHFPDIMDYDFTAEMEDDLDDIAKGEKKRAPVIKAFWRSFSSRLKKTENVKRIEVMAEETGQICPKCQKGREVIRIGKFGKFLSCSRFPDCDYRAPFIEKIGMKCPKCKSGDVIIKQTKTGRKFFGCSRYPNCQFASWKNPKEPGRDQKNKST